MTLQFDVARVRKPTFFVFRNREFSGIISGDTDDDAITQAVGFWGGSREEYGAVSWWRATVVLEQLFREATNA